MTLARPRGSAVSLIPETAGGPMVAPPAAPVGREAELHRLRSAFDAVAAGECRVLLVAGSAGAGKSLLMHQMEPVARARGGRFATGKFEHEQEREAAALIQALGALGRLVLADSGEEERAQLRRKILRTLGAQAGLVRVVPEFAQLLADVPDARTVDPAHAAARMAEVVTGLLRAIVSPRQPLVLVLDDLQWSGTLCTRVIDAILAASDIAGLLLLAAYRDDELPPDHPLAAAMLRWRQADQAPELLAVANLQPAQVSRLLAQMLGLRPASARRLALALHPHARGNPFDTVELVNALRDYGLLGNGPRRRQWHADDVQQFLRRCSVRNVLAARVAQLPRQARELLQTLACLGTQSGRETVRAASELQTPDFDAALGVLRERGFVLHEPANGAALRLRHDRIRQAAYATLHPRRRAGFHLALARRLAAHAQLAAMAADQYLLAQDELLGTPEAVLAARFLRAAAAQARLIGNHGTSLRMQAAALRLLEAAAGDHAADALPACEIEFHLALYSTGRLSEADAVYARILQRHRGAIEFIDAACAQVTSLTSRDRMDEAIDLGLQVLRDLGVAVPQKSSDLHDFPQRYERLRRWVEDFNLAQECVRSETETPWVAAAGKMIYRLLSPAAFKDIQLLAWLIFQSQELWEEHGACAPLAGNFIQANFMTIALMQDWRTGYLAARQALDLCEARGWHLEAAHARSGSIYWFEPLERSLREAERSREALLAVGNLRNASFSYRHSAICLFECGPTLHRYAEEIEGALALSVRADNRQAIARCGADHQLLRVLQVPGEFPTLFDREPLSARLQLGDDAARDWLLSYQACGRATACAIFGDAAGLSLHARVAMDKLASFLGLYPIVWVYWLCGLAAAWELQTDGIGMQAGEPRADELDNCIEWLRQRAIDAPFNFRHLHLHLQGERAWAAGQGMAAARWFDEAQGAAEQTCRPWHQALLTERMARLQLAQGWPHGASRLFAESHQLYAHWGAAAKAAQLASSAPLPFEPVAQAPRPWEAATAIGDDAVDASALLRAARAVNLERSPERLKSTVEDVLVHMTGATKVTLALWNEEACDWLVEAAEGPSGRPPSAVDATPHVVPLTAFRHAEHTLEALVVADAVCDERFAQDPYFRDVERCALMVVPILSRGAARAMLVLENKGLRGAFSPVRLDAVSLIAGQLAVSLENARLYQRLERKVGEQTRQLRDAQAMLLNEARRAGMAQIATNVLHDVGNVLNSVNVSAHVLADGVRQSRSVRVRDLAELLKGGAPTRRSLFAPGGKGRLLPRYLRELATALAQERDALLAELGRLGDSVNHIKNVVAMQQSYAGSSGMLETCVLATLVDDALRMQDAALRREGVQVVRHYQPIGAVPLDKARVMQVMLNLIENARQAMAGAAQAGTLNVAVQADDGSVSVTLADNGCGIAADKLTRIFSHGFTTRPGAHGFGLHSCAVAAVEMGGALTARSDGVGTGAAFTLRLPLAKPGGRPSSSAA